MNLELDALILSVVNQRFQKVAMIIAKTQQALGGKSGVSDEAIAKRLEHLVSSGQLKAAGDISKWRYCELRLSG